MADTLDASEKDFSRLDEFLAALPPLTAEPERQPDGEYAGEDIPITAGGGALMATVFNPNTVSSCLDPSDDEQAQYDQETLWFANLSAAATEMYFALKAVLNSDMAMREEDEGRESETLNIVRAAVARARGEAPDA